ncbi:MAG: patatin-like phospholipase family protein [Thermoanaerobaculia bacterium]
MPDPTVPVHEEHAVADDAPAHGPEEGIAVCLSGGGYRAMLFHAGVLWYLADAAILGKVDRISSVSGGSIAAGILGRRWNELTFDAAGKATNFADRIVPAVTRVASETIDKGSVIGGILTPGVTIGEKVIRAYRKYAFDGATLQDLPDHPRFVINATSVQSGVLFRFSKPYAWDYRVGRISSPHIPLAEAVAASSAFPPVLSPARIDLSKYTFDPGTGTDLQRDPYTRLAVLSDGGVYDNLGLETAFKRYRTLLVSDAGGRLQPEEFPKSDWARHAIRVTNLIDSQVRSLRKRQLVGAFKDGSRNGAYWGMWTDLAEYPNTIALPMPADRAEELARVPTRLASVDDDLQNRLINFGYAMAARAIRAFHDANAFDPPRFPRSGGI